MSDQEGDSQSQGNRQGFFSFEVVFQIHMKKIGNAPLIIQPGLRRVTGTMKVCSYVLSKLPDLGGRKRRQDDETTDQNTQPQSKRFGYVIFFIRVLSFEN
jgi:hypothetical protein